MSEKIKNNDCTQKKNQCFMMHGSMDTYRLGLINPLVAEFCLPLILEICIT